jgi:hypothetical protein
MLSFKLMLKISSSGKVFIDKSVSHCHSNDFCVLKKKNRSEVRAE